jgi:transcriptional regulator with XRE-family HTH domain
MKVGEKIRRARIAFGLSQVTLSLRLEKSQIWVSRLERGTQKATPEVIDQVFSAIRARQGLRETVKA